MTDRPHGTSYGKCEDQTGCVFGARVGAVGNLPARRCCVETLAFLPGATEHTSILIKVTPCTVVGDVNFTGGPASATTAKGSHEDSLIGDVGPMREVNSHWNSCQHQPVADYVRIPRSEGLVGIWRRNS